MSKTADANIVVVGYPILAFSHCRGDFSAVTNAGGFGGLGAVAHTPKQLEIDLTWIDEHVGGKPYGIDLLLPQKYEGADEGGLDRDALRQLLPAEQQAYVDDIMARSQVPALDDEQRAARSRLGRTNATRRAAGRGRGG